MSEEKSREQYVADGGPNIPEYGGPLGIWPYYCTVNAFRAILNEVGLHRTIEAIRPYNEVWGRTVVGMVKERLGQQESDLETIAMTWYYGYNCASMGHIKPLEIYEGGAICELFACPNPGMNAPPEMCIAMSHLMAYGWCQAINPEYEVIWTHHMGNGDDCCRWVLKKKESKFTVDDLGRLQKTVPLELSMAERMLFTGTMISARQLVVLTSALIGLVGSHRTLELVVPLARETGLQFGALLNRGAEGKGDLAMIKEKVDLLTSGLQQTGTPSMITDSGIEREIIDCPFKGAPPEACKQFEGVLNGVCEAIDPDFEFSYDRMMSGGAPTCHWAVRKRGSAVKGEVGKEAPIEDPAKMLALRFAKGEISHREFDKSMELLKKHQVVK